MPLLAETGRTDGVVLCWDIDGTLLTTNRSGIGAWEQAIREVCHRSHSLAGMHTGGVTDVEIAWAILKELALPPDLNVVERLIARYEFLLPKYLASSGRVLPGAREFLVWNQKNMGLRCMLLTGNTVAGARAKLENYQLAGFFTRGAFARLPLGTRSSIAQEARTIAQAWVGTGFEPRRMLVIGDTPHDVNCGRAIGARTLGVATGNYGTDALEAAGAWRAVENLPAPEELASLSLQTDNE